MTGDAATAYAKEVVAADFEEAGDGDVLRKVMDDFTAKGVAITEPEIRAKMDELMAMAAAAGEGGDVTSEYGAARSEWRGANSLRVLFAALAAGLGQCQ